MDFHETGLPDKQIFRDAFAAGFARYVSARYGDRGAAAREYRRGPLAMARLIFGHGGECRQLAAAACLAGPSLFSLHPADRHSKRLVEFAHEVRGVDDVSASGFYARIPGLSGDARLFLQATAIMLLEHMAGEPCDPRAYDEAFLIYSAARGDVDAFNLDTRFEIAAMKATSFMQGQGHIWAKAVYRAPAQAGAQL